MPTVAGVGVTNRSSTDLLCWTIRGIGERLGGVTAVFHCHRGNRSEASLCGYVIGWWISLEADGRLRCSDTHSESKLYKTRHTISKYHLKWLKNNTVDGDILKHLASLPPSLLAVFSVLPPFLPPSLLTSCLLTSSLLCFGDWWFFLFAEGCQLFFCENAAHVLLSSPLTKYQCSTFFLSQKLCSHAWAHLYGNKKKKKVVTYCNCI